MYHLPGVENLSQTRHHLEDAIDGLMQMGNNGARAVLASLGQPSPTDAPPRHATLPYATLHRRCPPPSSPLVALPRWRFSPIPFLPLRTVPAILFVFVLGGLFSIAFFNFFGISVTKDMSAAHRMVCRQPPRTDRTKST